jgi:hypothetical protein
VVERADGIEQAKDRPMADALHPQARAGDAILFFLICSNPDLN